MRPSRETKIERNRQRHTDRETEKKINRQKDKDIETQTVRQRKR